MRELARRAQPQPRRRKVLRRVKTNERTTTRKRTEHVCGAEPTPDLGGGAHNVFQNLVCRAALALGGLLGREWPGVDCTMEAEDDLRSGEAPSDA